MVRKADSVFFLEGKKAATKIFIAYVGAKARKLDWTLVKITDDLMKGESIGDKKSRTRQWCRYRKGGGSWPLSKLRIYTHRAKDLNYITHREFDTICEKIVEAERIREYEKIDKIEHRIIGNKTRFRLDISKSKNLLIQQIRHLPGRIQYGFDELEKIHYFDLALNSLTALHNLIKCLVVAKKEEEKILKSKYGTRDYEKIARKLARDKLNAGVAGGSHVQSREDFLAETKHSDGWWESPVQTTVSPSTKSGRFRQEVQKELDEISKKFRIPTKNDGTSRSLVIV